MTFLCSINGSAPVVFNYTGQSCGVSNPTFRAIDLNLPSITISRLNQTKVIHRTVTNVGHDETYSVGWTAPYGVSIKVSPTRFFIFAGQRQALNVSVTARFNNSVASFGRIGLVGDRGHTVNVPVSVVVKVLYNVTS